MNSRLCIITLLSLMMCSYSFAAAGDEKKANDDTKTSQFVPDPSEGSYDFVTDETGEPPSTLTACCEALFRYVDKRHNPEKHAGMACRRPNNKYEAKKTEAIHGVVKHQLRSKVLPTCSSVQKSIERTLITMQDLGVFYDEITECITFYAINEDTPKERAKALALIQGSKMSTKEFNTDIFGSMHLKLAKRARNELRTKMLDRVSDELKTDPLLALSDEEEYGTTDAATQTPLHNQLPTSDQPPATS